MSRFNRILCPIDLSANSMVAVKLATTIAKEEKSTIVFMFVAPQWPPDGALFGSEYLVKETKVNKKELENVRPTDKSVKFEHVFRNGNAGPEVVSESKRCDMVVMSTHGYGAMLRLLMGSVAQYTMRNAECPVVMVRIPELEKTKDDSTARSGHFVTEVMHHVAPVYEHNNIDKVLFELEQANESAAPVVDLENKAIGVLTKTDIDRYRSLQERFENKDQSVVKEMFEIDKYGHVRHDDESFDQVKRHMSSPPITISNTETTERAVEMFAADQTIHHLVVVDEAQRPLGIVKPAHCVKKPDRHSAAEPLKPTSN